MLIVKIFLTSNPMFYTYSHVGMSICGGFLEGG